MNALEFVNTVKAPEPLSAGIVVKNDVAPALDAFSASIVEKNDVAPAAADEGSSSDKFKTLSDLSENERNARKPVHVLAMDWRNLFKDTDPQLIQRGSGDKIAKLIQPFKPIGKGVYPGSTPGASPLLQMCGGLKLVFPIKDNDFSITVEFPEPGRNVVCDRVWDLMISTEPGSPKFALGEFLDRPGYLKFMGVVAQDTVASGMGMMLMNPTFPVRTTHEDKKNKTTKTVRWMSFQMANNKSTKQLFCNIGLASPDGKTVEKVPFSELTQGSELTITFYFGEVTKGTTPPGMQLIANNIVITKKGERGGLGAGNVIAADLNADEAFLQPPEKKPRVQ